MSKNSTIQVTDDLSIEQLVKLIINHPDADLIIDVAADAELLNNELNLRMLKFYSEEEKKELLIQSENPRLLAMAHRLGFAIPNGSGVKPIEPKEAQAGEELTYIYTEPEIAAAPEVSATTPVRDIHPRHGGFMPTLLVALFTFILAIWWFLLPKAIITVSPKEENIDFTTEAVIGPGFSDGDYSDGKIPARLLEKVTTTSVQIAATGQKLIGITPATGKITFINSGEQPVVLPKGTVVSGKDGVRFTTQKDALVPKAAPRMDYGIRVGTNWGRVDVGITAENKGSAGNIPAKTITILESKLGRSIQVINVTPTMGGTDKQVAIVTLEDVKKGEEQAKKQMHLAGSDEVNSLVGSDYLLLPDLVKLEPIHTTNSPDIGVQSDSVKTTLEYKVQIMAPALADVKKFLSQQFDQKKPSGFTAQRNSVQLVNADMVNVADLPRIRLFGKGRIKGILNPDKIKELIKGKTVGEAKQLLTKTNEIGDYSINITDEQARLPVFAFQIKMLIPSTGNH